MRKVIKISVHIFSALIIAAIVLPLMVALAIQLPAVQNFAVRRAAQWASNKLEAKVSIERIDIKFISRASVKGFYVEDYGGDTLLYAGRLEADILNTGLMGGTLTFGNAKLSDVRFKMHEDEDGTSNFRKIIERIKRKNPREERSPITLLFRSVEVENFYYRMIRREVRTDREGSVNFSDVEVERFDFRGSDVFIKGDSLHLNIEHMSFREKSGLYVPHFSARVDNLSGTSVDVKDVRLQNNQTDVRLASMRFESETWQSYRDFMEVITLEGVIENSTIDMATIRAFTPKVAGIDYVFRNIRGRASGMVKDLSGSIPYISLYDTGMSFDFRVRGLPEIEHTVFDVEIGSLATSSEDLENILGVVLEEPLPPKILSFLDGLGEINFHGGFHGSINDFNSQGALEASDTRAGFRLGMRSGSGDTRLFSGTAEAYGVDVGALSGSAKLGRAGVRATVNGTMGHGGLKGNADATIALVEFNDYRYRNIVVEGEFDNKRFLGHVASEDNNIKFDFDGMVDFNDSIPLYDFDLALHRADLGALNINKRDSVSVLHFDLKARARGDNPDNLNGVITISDLTYINDEDSVYTRQMEIQGRNSPDSKYLSFRSYFADATYQSRTSYSELFREMKQTLQSYLPSLAHGREIRERDTNGNRSADNYSVLTVDIKQANKAVGIFVPGLLLAEGSRMSLMFNPHAGQLDLSASSEFIEYKDNFASELVVQTRNEGDSLSVFVRAEDMYAARLYMPGFSLIGGLKNDRINISTRFVDSLRHMTALVGVAADLSRDSETEMVRTRLRFNPSTIDIGDRRWNIYSRGIEIDSSRIAINNFTIVGAGQNLTVDGVLGRDRSDTLHVNMTNFDLEPLTNFTSRLGYRVAGRTNGHADLISAKHDPILHARVEFDSVRLNDKPLPDALFESLWDFPEERARFQLTRNDGIDETIAVGYFRPSTLEYMGHVTMHKVDISFIEPFFKGIVRETSGTVDVDATMAGQGRQLKINGRADIDTISMTVDYLNVPYQIRNAFAEVKDNVITMNDVPVYDPYDNIAMFDMNVNLNNTQNISYNINVRPENLLALNTNETHNDLFYGRVFGSGSVNVSGNRGRVNLNIAATTSGNSEFYMPLRDYSMGISDIITFRRPEEQKPEISDYARRRMEIRSRKRRQRLDDWENNLSMTFDLNVQPNLLFQLIMDPMTGGVLRARGNGTLRIEVSPQADEFSMNGSYELTEGSYQFSLQGLINKRFTIEPGSRIVWFNDPLDATMDVSAVYTLRASLVPLLSDYDVMVSTVPVECRIIMTGNLTEPEITFAVDVPNADPEIRSLIANELSTQENVSTQFLSLLALNSFYNSGNGNIGSAGGSATAFDFLTAQLSNIVSNDNLHIGFRYSQRTDLTSDEFGLDISTPLFSNRLLLDIEGNYNAQNTPGNYEDVSNLSGDFSLTWLIDRPGNLRLRGFSRTIDRFDDLGLQESGIGIYYKEDFNVFGDIVRNFRERFSRKRKRQSARQGTVVNEAPEEETVSEEGAVEPPNEPAEGAYGTDY